MTGLVKELILTSIRSALELEGAQEVTLNRTVITDYVGKHAFMEVTKVKVNGECFRIDSNGEGEWEILKYIKLESLTLILGEIEEKAYKVNY